jgi:tetratricopeptide (TPR) repeat protein
MRAVHAYHKFTSADNLVAIELLAQVIERESSNARAHALMAKACLARVERGWESDIPRWLGAAHDASERALQLDPATSEAYSARGLIFFFMQRNAEAEGEAREALGIDNNNDVAHDLIGRIRFARGEFMGAIAAYRDALRINPYYVWCHNDLAWALMMVGAEDEAEQVLDRVLAISPSDEGGHCGKAALHLVRGRAGDALIECRKAQASNPLYPFVLQMLPPILARNGLYEEATQLCMALIESPQTSFIGNAGLGLVYAEIGDRQRLEVCVERFLQEKPFYAPMSLSYAVLYHAVGEKAVAEQLVAKAVREGVRLVEINQWHPTLKQLAQSLDTHTTGSVYA